jgi:hypothetical protein
MSEIVTRYYLAGMILRQVGVEHPYKYRHIGARRALVAWMGEESSWFAPCNGVPGQGAAFNPLNTTQNVAGGTSGLYNKVPGVKNYFSALYGAEAVAQTLSQGGHNYEPIVALMNKKYVHGVDILKAVADSDWGTFHNADGSPNYELAQAIMDTYNNSKNRDVFNAVQVGIIV